MRASGSVSAVRRLARVARLGGLVVDGKKRFAAATLLGALAVPFVRHEVLEQRQEIRTKLAPFHGDVLQIILVKQAVKKNLGEVFGVVVSMSAPADEGVEGYQ